MNTTTKPSNPDTSATKPSAKSALNPHVSDIAFEFLLAEILHWVEVSSETITTDGAGGEAKNAPRTPGAAPSTINKEEQAILSAERAAAKIERLGFSVGYRLCERLSQSKPIVNATSGEGGASSSSVSSNHLECVKFLCKEFWTEVFRKQIDKLQTNHRGVFVLKDSELRWLRRLPADDERARVSAIKILAFPCGLIRGALGNLGIAAVVSCDFLADGKNMASCSFNIKIKA